MHKLLGILLLVMSLSIFSGCAGITPNRFEPPDVSLHTFKMLPQDGVTPRFEIGLHIINPNRESLNIEGIYYTVDIEGYKVLAGVANNLQSVEPYGQADITLVANVDLIKGIRLISSLMQAPRDVFSFSFNAKLDPGGFAPKIVVQEEGEFNLRNER